MNIFICDDDPLYVQLIETKIKEYKPHNLSLTITSSSCPQDIIQKTKTQKFDIAFLDIELQITNGIHIAYQIQKQNPYCLIIFMTNYPQYVTDAFSLHAFQYLLKPMQNDRLKKEFEKACQIYCQMTSNFTFNTQEGKVTLHPQHILYIETYYNDINIVTKHHTYVSNIKNKNNIINSLLPFDFYQIHQSYYVNFNHIHAIYNDHIILQNKEKLPISSKLSHYIIKEYHEFLLKSFPIQ